MSFAANQPDQGKHNCRVTFTPTEDSNSGKPFTCSSGTEFGFDPAGEAISIEGGDIHPIVVVPGAAKPTISVTGMLASETSRFIEHLAPSGGAYDTYFNVQAVLKRRGTPTRTYEARGCILKKGGGFKAGGDGVRDDVEAAAADVLLNGKSIFTRNEE